MSFVPKILVTGADGQVGHALLKCLSGLGNLIGSDLVPTQINVPFYQMDFCDKKSILDVLRQIKPDIIVNPAAYTAVDKAETDRERSSLINVEAPKVLACYCFDHNIPLIHFSTDYVFPGSGTSARTELDPTGPLNFYGQSKLLGEKAIQDSRCPYIILRTSWVFSSHGQNFVKTMIRLGEQKDQLKIVGDQFGAPTSAFFLAEMVGRVILQGLDSGWANMTGLYHLCNSGETTWCEFAKLIFVLWRNQGKNLKINDVFPIKSEEYPTPAARPKNSRLDCSKFKNQYKIEQLQTWQDALKLVIQDLGTKHVSVL